jgi:hypothetical protein
MGDESLNDDLDEQVKQAKAGAKYLYAVYSVGICCLQLVCRAQSLVGITVSHLLEQMKQQTGYVVFIALAGPDGTRGGGDQNRCPTRNSDAQ